jgi:hypothetical protein
MAFRPLKSFFPTADELLHQDLPTLGRVLLIHLKSYEGLSTVCQYAGINRGYFRAMLENRNVGLGPLPKEPEYGIRQPEVTKRMMEAWNWLERQGLLIHNDEQVGDWFTISGAGDEYLAQEEVTAPSQDLAKSSQPSTRAPRALLSYSWEDSEHEQWVTKFATRLQGESGVEIVFDKWHLKPGDDKLHFMERAVANSDFVIVICTPTYATRANKRQGGVGYESMVITSEMAEHILTNKFVPVLRKGTWTLSLPTYLKSRMGVDLRKEPYDEGEYEKLLRALHKEPVQPPPLGGKPKFSTAVPSEVRPTAKSRETGTHPGTSSQPIKEDKPRGLSLRPTIQHRRLPVPGGPADEEELYELMVGIENDGEQDATDFRLDVEIPSGAVDGGGYIIEKRASRPGVRLFQVIHTDRSIQHLYPGTAISDLVKVNCVIWGTAKRETPESLQEKIIATVYSGSMRPRVGTITLSDLRN